MALLAQPFRHPDSGIYYLRRRVPDALRQILGKTELRWSLGTRDHLQAKAAFVDAFAESERLFAKARLDGEVSRSKGYAICGANESPKTDQFGRAHLTISQLFAQYVHALSASGKQAHVAHRHEADYGRAVKRFMSVVGDIGVQAITGQDIHSFASQLIQPSDPATRPLAISSARLVIARLSSVLGFAVDIGQIDSNPASTSRVNKRLRTNNQRHFDNNKGYSWSELVTLFGHAEYKAFRTASGRPGYAVFWVPIIAFYTGMRREEIAQLYVSDLVKDSSGSWFIRVDDDKPDKSVKTTQSRRDVPVHDDLIRLGILALMNGRRSDERLFPELVKNADGYAGIVSKAWRSFSQRVGVYKSGRNPLHAFRHTFKSMAREHGIPREVSDWITGHAPETVGDCYGHRPRLRMTKEIKKLPSLVDAAGLFELAKRIL